LDIKTLKKIKENRMRKRKRTDVVNITSTSGNQGAATGAEGTGLKIFVLVGLPLPL